MEEILQKVKKSLRITHIHFDDEILDLIEAGFLDLKISGVKNLPIDDALVLRVITLYCKAHFGLVNADSDKYKALYDSLKVHLALSGDYNVIQ